MNSILKWSGVVALVILAIMGVFAVMPSSEEGLGVAVDCSQNTCIAGGFGLTTGPLQVDGNSIFNGNVTLTGTPTITGNVSITGTLGVSATTTLSDTVNFNNPGLCINFFATSTATRLHLVASTTATVPNGAAAVMTAEYGACAL